VTYSAYDIGMVLYYIIVYYSTTVFYRLVYILTISTSLAMPVIGYKENKDDDDDDDDDEKQCIKF
jgi:hypothetical protein